MTEPFAFPKDFLWGVAGAAHQVEGGNSNSDSWLLEHIPGGPFVEPSGDACDHYHRYESDIALIAALSFNTYRFSIEWARIEPEEGEFSNAVLDHYRRMLAACHEHHLTPMVTYHHFTSPRWFAAKGGWEVLDNAHLFVRYAERATQHLGDLIGAVCTFNEPNVGLLIQQMGMTPSDEVLRQAPWRAAAAKAVGSDTFAAFPHCAQGPARDTFLKAHPLAVQAIKSGPGDFPVGMTLALTDHQAMPGGEDVRNRARAIVDDVFLDVARGDDFIGVQTYTRMRYGANGPLPPEAGVPVTQMGYEFYPEALEGTIRYAADYTGSPVIVTENGLGSENDTERIDYVRRALKGVQACLEDGIHVQGYCYWSVFDNFEWTLGYRPKFGLIAVDRETQVRTLKRSAAWLGQIAQTGVLE
ncbi:MAG TPA: glycoside hydrolase family 1 protein [Candidatus Limnocylindrales bacterium]|nr:glycoside hydrolase family 1 protein [Candidatus Limnocylindrales bacterium]